MVGIVVLTSTGEQDVILEHPQSSDQKRTSNLELFFDLVFVFAITQIARLLHDDHTAGGWGRAALVMWLVWWAWSQYTWAGNVLELERRWTRVAMLTATGFTLLAAVSIPDTFDDSGAWFAVPYVAIRATGLALYASGMRGDAAHRAALRTYLPVAMIGPAVVLIGGLVGREARPWIWTIAVFVDIASVLAAGRGEFRVSAVHFAERHALIVIVALGESIVAVGATAAGTPMTASLVIAAGASFAAVAAMWWTYFEQARTVCEQSLYEQADHRRRSNAARDVYTLGHLPLVAGIVVFAVGVEGAVLHPTLHLDRFGRLAIGLGLALFLLGVVVDVFRAAGRLQFDRVVAVVVVALVVGVLGGSVSAITTMSIVAVVLIVACVVEARLTPAE